MIAQDRDLHTGLSVWAGYRLPRVAACSMGSSLSADVTIIGCGISGAMIAEALSGHGLEIAIVDKRKPLSGSTLASTALLQYEIDEPLSTLSGKIGAGKAAAAWRRSHLGVESLAMKILTLGIDCAFERKDSLYLSGNLLDSKGLEAEGRARAAIGLPSQFLSRKDLHGTYGIRADAALLSQGNIAVNPVQLTAGLLNTAIKRGAKLYTPVGVDKLTQKKNHIILTTHAGFTIKTRYVIYATGYEIPLATKTRKHKIFSTWALATKPLRGFSLPLFWESADPYIYGRTTMDGRLVFGGEDEEFSDAGKRDSLIPEKQKALEKKIRKILPGHAFETDYVWAGSFGASTTGLPSIGKIPRQKNCYAVMAYGGNGITFSRIAAELIAADILGYNDPDKRLFAFS